MVNEHGKDQDLIEILEFASNHEPDGHSVLCALIDIITDEGNGRISLSDNICSELIDIKGKKVFNNKSTDEICHQIQTYGSNSIASLFRGDKGVSYHEIVCDVASHMNVEFLKSMSTVEVEDLILAKIAETAFDKMNPKEREAFLNEFNVKIPAKGAIAIGISQLVIKQAGFSAYKFSLIAANSFIKAVSGKGLALGANAALVQGMKVFAGPIGWAVTGIWTIFDLSSPAFRVTVPAVIQVAFLRKLRDTKFCSNCECEVTIDSNFCTNCGNKLHQEK